MATFVAVGRADEVGEGEAKAFDANGTPVAVARVDGVLYAFSDVCTHRRCNLAAGGELEGTEIVCECHGSSFSIVTGEATSPPATEPIATYPVREVDGELQVEV
ncbi:MAG: ferredoxin [Actinomycetota bacterium]|jgi:3-phenylpropionate/trans-cinnamate dioxygenase ferredoxin subunit|nr:MAG: ferredoxin [Actinomycetota bacterium]